MNQFKDLFLGRERRDYRRATTAQKCMRVSGKHNDLDNVGPSDRHHTFFEMLGNFSFGDYFKPDAIAFAWELLTTVWKLEPGPVVSDGLQGRRPASRATTRRSTSGRRSCPPSRITELGLADNFWQMGETGPCGRCSEIMYFRGNDIPCDEPVCKGIECDCERYVEVWNNVFMEFDRGEGGTLTPLPAQVDRHGHGSRADHVGHPGHTVDLRDGSLPADPAGDRRPHRAARYTGTTRPLDHPDVSMRVVADHLRAMTFLIADGVLPSNEWRGLCAAQDHAARHASREEARSQRAVPAHARRRRRSRDGRELPGARPSARRDRPHRPCRRKTGLTRC